VIIGTNIAGTTKSGSVFISGPGGNLNSLGDNTVELYAGGRGGFYVNSIVNAVGTSYLEYDASTSAITYSVSVPSSLRYKENVHELSAVEDKKYEDIFDNLKIVQFDYKDSDEVPEQYRGLKDNIGMIAEEVEKVFPWAVKKVGDRIETIYFDRLIMPLFNEVKQLKKVIIDLKNENKQIIQAINYYIANSIQTDLEEVKSS